MPRPVSLALQAVDVASGDFLLVWQACAAQELHGALTALACFRGRVVLGALLRIVVLRPAYLEVLHADQLSHVPP